MRPRQTVCHFALCLWILVSPALNGSAEHAGGEFADLGEVDVTQSLATLGETAQDPSFSRLPSLFVTDEGQAFLLFSDASSRPVHWCEASGDQVRVIGSIDKPVLLDTSEWFVDLQRYMNCAVRGDELEIYFQAEGYTREGVAVLECDGASKSLRLKDLFPVLGHREFPLRGMGTRDDWLKARANIDRVMPWRGNGNIVFGRYERYYFHPGVFWSGHLPEGTRVFSVLREEDGLHEYQDIPKGRVHVYESAYAVTDDGTYHAAWIQGPPQPRVRTAAKHAVCYASNPGGRGWSRAKRLYSARVKDAFGLRDLSMSRCGEHLVVSWTHPEDGVMAVDRHNGTWTKPFAGKQITAGTGSAGTENQVRGLRVVAGPRDTVVAGYLAGPALHLSVRRKGSWGEAIRIGPPHRSVVEWIGSVDARGILHLIYKDWAPGRAFCILYRRIRVD